MNGQSVLIIIFGHWREAVFATLAVMVFYGAAAWLIKRADARSSRQDP